MSHSRASPNPTGGDGSRRDLTQPALHEALMVRVVDSANMRRAWKRVKDSVTRFLTRELALVVNEQKSRAVKTNECLFLGFTLRRLQRCYNTRTDPRC